MFITGPEVIKTVTGEEVGFEELGGAMSHNSKSGVAHFASDDEDAASRTRATCSRSCRRTTSRRPRGSLRPTIRCGWTPSSTRVVPDSPNKPYDMRDVIRHVVDDGEFFEVHEHYARNIVCGFARLDGFAVGVVGNQPAQLAGRARHRQLREGRALHPHLRRVQHPDPHVLRRPRVPAGHDAGVGRDHPSRREAALRLRGGDRPEDHRDHAQVLRRRVRRDGLQAPRRRLELRVADRRGRRDGSRGRGQHHLPPRHRRVADARRAPPEADRRLQGALRQPLRRRPSAATSTT